MEKPKDIDLGTFSWDIEKDIQAKMDNDLKIAILNFLSKADPYLSLVLPNEKKTSPYFEKIFHYIKNI